MIRKVEEECARQIFKYKETLVVVSKHFISLTCGLLLPPKPIVTTESTVVAPRLLLAGISVPLSVLTSQNVTHEQQTIRASGI